MSSPHAGLATSARRGPAGGLRFRVRGRPRSAAGQEAACRRSLSGGVRPAAALRSRVQERCRLQPAARRSGIAHPASWTSARSVQPQPGGPARFGRGAPGPGACLPGARRLCAREDRVRNRAAFRRPAARPAIAGRDLRCCRAGLCQGQASGGQRLRHHRLRQLPHRCHRRRALQRRVLRGACRRQPELRAGRRLLAHRQPRLPLPRLRQQVRPAQRLRSALGRRLQPQCRRGQLGRWACAAASATAATATTATTSACTATTACGWTRTTRSLPGWKCASAATRPARCASAHATSSKSVGSWTRSLLDGKASFTLAGRRGANSTPSAATATPTSSACRRRSASASPTSWAASPSSGGRTIATTSSALGAAGDSLTGIGTRNDNLYEVGGGLTWQFLPTWSLNPEILYIRDQSNILAANYSSTEIWITLRKDF